MLGRNSRTLSSKIADEFVSHDVDWVFINFHGRVHVQAREYQFQGLGRIGAIQEADYVRLVKLELFRTAEPDIEFELDEIVEQGHIQFDMGLPERLNRKMAR
jgi:hypothetical protein